MAHAVSATLWHVTALAGLNRQVPVALLQTNSPLHLSPSSCLAQSASDLHVQVLVPGLQAPPLQASPVVQLSPSSQGAPGGTASIAHAPVAGRQVFLMQILSAPLSQSTTDAGLTLHSLLAGSQNNVPLQASPSSLVAQSALVLHVQMLALGAHTPALHASPVVHLSPSSQGLASASAAVAHFPVFGSQATWLHASLAAAHVTTVCATTLHDHGRVALSQASVPLQGSPSSCAAQSLSCLHAQMLADPATQLPLSQASPMEQRSPSSHGVPLATGAAAHSPVAGTHTRGAHSVALAWSQVTTAWASRTQRPGLAEVSQTRWPLHLLPSSKGAQSASVSHPVGTAAAASAGDATAPAPA